MTRHLPEQTRREQILTAARKCFIERGYYPTRMEDIAAAAGLSKGGVYFHFDSKGQVFDTLVQEEYARSMDFLTGVSAGEAPVAEKMQILARHYLEYFSTASDAPRFFIVMGEMGLRDEQLAKKLLEMQGAYITQISKLVEQGITEGVLRPVDARAVGALLKALIDGIEGLQALQYPIEIEKLLGVGLELVLGGLVKRS
jgi:AcrR family transcriptional regulator